VRSVVAPDAEQIVVRLERLAEVIPEPGEGFPNLWILRR